MKTLQQMSQIVMLCTDSRREEFLKRLADRCFNGDIERAEAVTIMYAAGVGV